ncbi:unnamed protein product [Protopolystoma xenopodis]|uniref:Uncharacterized protein n=1 Tax=Protopolystoma xenopodis TaxID=117903 RepID=A0A3S5AVG8_9PLAT|nr:unnamed protein product [Protopolystoma xenopodis]
MTKRDYIRLAAVPPYPDGVEPPRCLTAWRTPSPPLVLRPSERCLHFSEPTVTSVVPSALQLSASQPLCKRPTSPFECYQERFIHSDNLMKRIGDEEDKVEESPGYGAKISENLSTVSGTPPTPGFHPRWPVAKAFKEVVWALRSRTVPAKLHGMLETLETAPHGQMASVDEKTLS